VTHIGLNYTLPEEVENIRIEENEKAKKGINYIAIAISLFFILIVIYMLLLWLKHKFQANKHKERVK
jgi:flagellar biogenesis protein FliO